jgi:energy-coupling factor transport system substrate-specific component
MASKYYFSTRDLLVIAVLAALGGVLSTYISYLANMINHLVGVPFGAGNVVAGLHVLWLLLMIAITRKIGSGLIGGALKGFVEFITGNPHCIIVVVISTIEGLGAELGYWPLKNIGPQGICWAAAWARLPTSSCSSCSIIPTGT